MNQLQLDARLLHSAVIYACFHLVSQREALNAINVFPVADGDTGNNMASTAEAIITHSSVQPTLEETMKSIANAAILGARGNSGMIFSQFFNGLLTTASGDVLTTPHFAELIESACQSVRKAIVNPIEGTILTVMEVWALSLQKLAITHLCFNTLLTKSIEEAEKALQSTMQTLSILSEAKVVDAGALGFTLFIQGFASFIANPQQIPEKNTLENEQYTHENITFTEPPERRYCTEALLTGEALDKDQLSHLLQNHGDSIVLTGNDNLCRFHVHCNEPSEVFSSLRTLGRIQYPKVDDMLRQYEVAHKPKASIALVTDSSADLPQAFLDQYQIHLITLNVHIDGHDLLDKYSIDNSNFYSSLGLTVDYPTTSSPTAALIKQKISYLAHEYDEVLIISVAQILSGTCNAFTQAAKDHSNVHVINSRSVSGSQALLVNYAAELIAAGLPMTQLKEALLEKIDKTYLFVIVDQFDSLIRSGRVSKLKGKFAQLTGMKPILSLTKEGEGIVFDKAFNEVKALSKLITEVNKLAAGSKGLDKYCIIHAGVQEKAMEFARMTHEALRQPPLFIEAVSTAIGLHAGQGCIALAVTLR